MKTYITTILFCIVTITVSSQGFNNIHKLVEAKKYKEAIPQLREFLTKEHKHISANYDLAVSYRYLLSELATIQNANVNNQNIALWSDKEYQSNLTFWKNGITYTDSSIYYYKMTSELMNIGFLELELVRYPEFFEVTNNCNVIIKVKCARNYIALQIEELNKVNANNKSNLFNVEKEYETFRQNNSQTQQSYSGSYSQEREEGTESVIYLTKDNNNWVGYEEYTNMKGIKTKTNFNNIQINGDKISLIYAATNFIWEGYFKDNQLVFTTTKKGDPMYTGNSFTYIKR